MFECTSTDQLLQSGVFNQIIIFIVQKVYIILVHELSVRIELLNFYFAI